MKKILIFSLAYYPRASGAEIAIKEITDRVSDVEWHMVTLRFGREPLRERIGSVEVHRVGFGGSYLSKVLFMPLAALKARALHRREKFDALWAMMSYMAVPLVLANLRLPYVLTLQEGDTEEYMFKRLRARLLLPLINYGFRHARVVQAISNYLAQWAARRGYRGPLEVVPNGVDTRHFSAATDHFEIRKALDIRENETVLVTSSRLVPKNAVDVVLRALPALPGAHFLILGVGPEEQALKALARELAVEARVYFVGHVSHVQLPAYLQAATVFVRPSRSEGMGNSFIEAMAAGLPVIATQEGGLKDFISSETAWPVRKDNPEDIAAAVRDILGNREHTKKVVERAQKLVFEKYDWDLIVKQMRTRVFSQV